MTAAPITGNPVASTTVPDIDFPLCAKTLSEKHRKAVQSATLKKFKKLSENFI